MCVQSVSLWAEATWYRLHRADEGAPAVLTMPPAVSADGPSHLEESDPEEKPGGASAPPLADRRLVDAGGR
jgi:hypothetical protein